MKGFLACLMLFLLVPAAIASDGIPDNCETGGVEGRLEWFARYDLNNGRLVLVDWTTGAEVRVIDAAVPYRLGRLTWSPNCRYLTGSVVELYSSTYRTYLWDVSAGTRTLVAENGSAPHPVTWASDSGSITVKTRFGDFIYAVATGERTPLDAVTGWNGQQLTAVPDLPFGCRAGRPVSADLLYSQVTGRLVVRDTTTGDILWVVAENMVDLIGARHSDSARFFSPDCRYLFLPLSDRMEGGRQVRRGVVWSVLERREVMSFANLAPYSSTYGYYECGGRSSRARFDPSGRFLLVQTYNGVKVWDSTTNAQVTLATDYPPACDGRSFRSYRFEPAGQITTTDLNGERAVYDLATGARVG